MTERLYYHDAEMRSFTATVRTCEVVEGRARVLLDRTAFYPTSGGQPFDTGHLDQVSVIDVIDLDDGEVAHVVSGPLVIGQSVEGTIDWPRRADHMQQHTGQHVLSAAFDRLFDLPTLSFHLGTDLSTIDLSREATQTEIGAAEDEANRVVWEDRAVRTRMVSAEQAATLPLRKAPTRSGELRIVEVSDFDWSACGGTHVSRTGQIGVIAVVASERFKGGTRVSFVCGRRALESHRALRDVVAAARRVLSVTPGEIAGHIERLQVAARDADRQARGLQQELDVYRAAEIRQHPETIGPRRVVLRQDSRTDGAALKGLAQAVVAGSDLVAICVGAGQPAPVAIACGPGAMTDAGALVKALTAALGGRGGGRPELAQAGVPADPDAIVRFLRQQLDS